MDNPHPARAPKPRDGTTGTFLVPRDPAKIERRAEYIVKVENFGDGFTGYCKGKALYVGVPPGKLVVEVSREKHVRLTSEAVQRGLALVYFRG
ncbi:MAG: hypothetical protein V4510_10455 [bacterium]